MNTVSSVLLRYLEVNKMNYRLKQLWSELEAIIEDNDWNNPKPRIIEKSNQKAIPVKYVRDNEFWDWYKVNNDKLLIRGSRTQRKGFDGNSLQILDNDGLNVGYVHNRGGKYGKISRDTRSKAEKAHDFKLFKISALGALIFIIIILMVVI